VALLIDQLAWTASCRPDEVAYVDLASGETLTFADWDRRSNQLARGLIAAGVRPGDRVALHLESAHLCRWLVAYPAIHKAAAVAVPTNTRLSEPELARVLGHAEPTVVITSAALAPVVDAVRAGVPSIRLVIDATGPGWDAHLIPDDSPLPLAIDEGDLADIMYTSGTTGLPKGIAVRHRNTHLVPNGEPPWTGDAWIHASPLFTFAGMSFIYNPMKMGMRGLFLSRFDVDGWIDAVEAHRPSSAFLVPAMVQLLVQSERFATADLSCLRLVSIGSAPLPPSLHAAIADRVPDAMVSNSYSMTEVGSAFTFMPPGELHKRVGSVGIPMGTKIRIVDDDGEDLPTGTVGEVLVHVGEHHREYYRDPDATAATWAGEWVRSGDLGELDADGYLYIRGRKKDMIIRGGNNIPATDVEAVLYEHPAVLEAAVVAVPHDVLGEDVGAAVVLTPAASAAGDVDAGALRAFCAERLADYKVPRRIWFLDELPRNPTGKVLKRDIAIPPA
jgi:acyl-CoA synthetase (AMP-forming)/AMP-acid ligase II